MLDVFVVLFFIVMLVGNIANYLWHRDEKRYIRAGLAGAATILMAYTTIHYMVFHM